MIRQMIFALCAAGLLAACAAGPQKSGQADRSVPFAKNPTVILTQDIAQSRLAGKEGVWAALRESAADSAVLFVPQPVAAAQWLEKPSIEAGSRKWEPFRVFMSCDGKTGVTTGAWSQDGKPGYYTTVWQYFQRAAKPGEWRWMLHHHDYTAQAAAEPDMLQTRTASCDGAPTASVAAPAEGVQMKQGFSRDQSLSWTWQYRPDGSRYLSVNIWNGAGWEKAFSNKVKAPR